MQDARLWLLHTNGETKIVIVLSFTEVNSKKDAASATSHQELTIPTTASNDEANPPRLQTTGNDEANPLQTTGNQEVTVPTITGYKATVHPMGGDQSERNLVPQTTLDESERNLAPRTAGDHSETNLVPPTTPDESASNLAPPTTGDHSETNLIESIDEETDLHDLAEQLLILNEHGKLRQPLLGNVHARLHIFKASDAGDDIVQSFSANLLPPEPEGSTAPTEFEITLLDMLGNQVPKKHDPADKITFVLEDLKEVIESSIPRTARLRATHRAIKLLKENVGLDEAPTFAQRKRQRLDPIGIWK